MMTLVVIFRRWWQHVLSDVPRRVFILFTCRVFAHTRLASLTAATILRDTRSMHAKSVCAPHTRTHPTSIHHQRTRTGPPHALHRACDDHANTYIRRVHAHTRSYSVYSLLYAILYRGRVCCVLCVCCGLAPEHAQCATCCFPNARAVV